MKLKYILPVATIASVAGIVTPLVSCGNNGGGSVTPDPTPDKDGWMTWDFSQFGGFKTQPTAMLGGHEVDQDVLTDAYFDFINNDYTQFMREWFYCGINEINHDIGFLAPQDTWKIKVTEADKEKHLLSFDLKCEYWNGEKANASGQTDKMSFDISINKIEMEADRDNSINDELNMGMFYAKASDSYDWDEYLAADNNGWSITGNYYMEVFEEGLKEEGPVNLNKDNILDLDDDSLLYDFLHRIVFNGSDGLLNFKSLYLATEKE